MRKLLAVRKQTTDDDFIITDRTLLGLPAGLGSMLIFKNSEENFRKMLQKSYETLRSLSKIN